MRVALARQDIGSVYRQLQAEGQSQATFAEWIRQGQSGVWASTHGRPVVSYQVPPWITAGLGVPGGYLGLSRCVERGHQRAVAVAAGGLGAGR